MPRLQSPYHMEIPSVTLLVIMLNVFEVAHSPAQFSKVDMLAAEILS